MVGRSKKTAENTNKQGKYIKMTYSDASVRYGVSTMQFNRDFKAVRFVFAEVVEIECVYFRVWLRKIFPQKYDFTGIPKEF